VPDFCKCFSADNATQQKFPAKQVLIMKITGTHSHLIATFSQLCADHMVNALVNLAALGFSPNAIAIAALKSNARVTPSSRNARTLHPLPGYLASRMRRRPALLWVDHGLSLAHGQRDNQNYCWENKCRQNQRGQNRHGKSSAALGA